MFYKIIEGKRGPIVVELFGGKRVPLEEEALVLGFSEISKEKREKSFKPKSESEWNRKALFGYCPTCGEIGIEDLPGSECENAFFRCSNKNCYSKVAVEDGGFKMMPTCWSEAKPSEWREKEQSGSSWNWVHFPEIP